MGNVARWKLIKVLLGRPSSQTSHYQAVLGMSQVTRGQPVPDPAGPIRPGWCGVYGPIINRLEWLLALQPETRLICSDWVQP